MPVRDPDGFPTEQIIWLAKQLGVRHEGRTKQQLHRALTSAENAGAPTVKQVELAIELDVGFLPGRMSRGELARVLK